MFNLKYTWWTVPTKGKIDITIMSKLTYAADTKIAETEIQEG